MKLFVKAFYCLDKKRLIISTTSDGYIILGSKKNNGLSYFELNLLTKKINFNTAMSTWNSITDNKFFYVFLKEFLKC